MTYPGVNEANKTISSGHNAHAKSDLFYRYNATRLENPLTIYEQLDVAPPAGSRNAQPLRRSEGPGIAYR